MSDVLETTRAEGIEEQKDAIDTQVDNLRLYRDGLLSGSHMGERVDKMIDDLLAQKDALAVSPWLNYDEQPDEAAIRADQENADADRMGEWARMRSLTKWGDLP